MKYYPVFLRVAGRPCLVIGGGSVAQQKAESLLRAGAQVTVISPQLNPGLSALAAAGQIEHRQRPYASGDVHGFSLAYAATGDGALHTRIKRDAQDAGVLLNVVDQPHLCDFIVPSVVQRGDLLVAASTSGTSPALAKRIRQDLDGMLGAEYDLALQLLVRLRKRLARRRLTSPERRRIFTSLVNSPLLDYLRERQAGDIDRLLAATVGPGVSLASLGMELT